MSENKNSYTKFMIMKKLYKDGNKQVYLLSNKNGYKNYKDLFIVTLSKNRSISISPYTVKEDIILR